MESLITVNEELSLDVEIPVLDSPLSNAAAEVIAGPFVSGVENSIRREVVPVVAKPH